MDRRTELELMRLAHGELPPARARELAARIEREPELAAAWRRLAGTWEGLELPPPAPAPPGFAQRVLARAREHARPAPISWAAAPGWVRATAAAALVVGVTVGAGVGARFGTAPADLPAVPGQPAPAVAAPVPAAPAAPPAGEPTAADDLFEGVGFGGTSLAESYRAFLEGAADPGGAAP